MVWNVFNVVLSLIFIEVYTQQSVYQVAFERVEILFPEPNVYKGNVTNRKYNRTTLVLDSYYEQLVWLVPGECTIKIMAFQFLSNRYRMTSIQFEIDYCMTLISNDYGQQEYHTNSNYPKKCPIPPGKYYVLEATLPTNLSWYKMNIPKNFIGKWKLSFDNLLRGKSYFVYNIYFQVFYKPKWQPEVKRRSSARKSKNNKLAIIT